MCTPATVESKAGTGKDSRVTAPGLVSFAKIEAFAEEIVRLFKPQKIILFGSYAYGYPTQDSDVDLFVIMPFDPRKGRKSLEIRLALDTDFPLDLLVERPKDIQRRLKRGDRFLKEIMSKGRVLHDRQQ